MLLDKFYFIYATKYFFVELIIPFILLKKIWILPDEDMIRVLNQNMGNARFVWNRILSNYNELYELFRSHGYPLKPNIRNFNAILKMLKQKYSFLREGESTSQQQVFRDLAKSFNRFFNGISNYPKFKSKRNPK